MNRLSLFCLSCLISGIGLSGLGCSGGASLNPVEGKVMYKNQPLAGALVSLHPKGQNDVNTVVSVGLTKDDGTFTVTTGKNDGAPAGEYVVTIVCSRPVSSAKKGVISTAGLETEDVLQGAYASRDRSQLTATIKSGKNKLEPFDLK